MNLKEWRESGQLTQKDVADQIGCTKQAVSNIETGKASASLEIALLVTRISRGAVNLHTMIHRRQYTESIDSIAIAKKWDFPKIKVESIDSANDDFLK